MIEMVVRYLRQAGVPFRVASYPAPEPLPPVAHRFTPGALLVDAHVVLVGGGPALACAAAGAPLNLRAFAAETGAAVLDSSSADLRDQYRDAPEPLPPLGGLFGVPLFVDERASRAAILAFRAFGANQYVEVPFEDFARVERPRLASFAQGGELPPHGG